MLQKKSVKVALHTLGCKVNQYETQAIKENLLKEGFVIAGEGERAEVHIINTCTVTNVADRKSRQIIRRAIGNDPDALVVVTGCYAQMKKEEIESIEGVSIITGTDEKSEIPGLIRRYMDESHGEHGRRADRHLAVKEYEELTEYEDMGVITGMSSRTRAFVKIQEGCDRFCSYCIIPFARGKVRSRDEEDIVREVSGLVTKGYREVVLTGINTALYGTERETDGKLPLLGLLKKLDTLDGDFRIRLSSLEPTVVGPEDVRELFDIKRLCHHLHLSIQSGSDKVLRSMNRDYGRDDYLKVVEALRTVDPYYGISTDIIVGFPGEHPEDFQDSLKITEEVDFVRIHGFKYSVRQGTCAAEMDDQISPETKDERAAALSEAAGSSMKRFLDRSAGDSRVVLIERKEEVAGVTYMTGYTDNYIKVYLEEGTGIENSFRKVRLDGMFEDGMRGTYV